MKTIKLHKPLQVGKTEITELKFREYTTAADYLSFDVRGGVAQRVALIASLTGNEVALIERLSGRDYTRAAAIADAMIEEDALPDLEAGDEAAMSQAQKDAAKK
jgi:Phage tail assembly chaperone proteins, E, or 41 or 14